MLETIARTQRGVLELEGRTELSTTLDEYTVTAILHETCDYCLGLAHAAIRESLLVGNPFISKGHWGLNSEGISELLHSATVAKTALHENYLAASEKVKEEVLRGIQYCV
jgi:hypothetical protein